MNGLILSLAVGLAPQGVPPNAEAVVVARAMVRGKLALEGLSLGDGGVRAVRNASRGRPRNRVGEVRTPGGVLVRAKSEGAKFDFPSGRELLVSPDGRVHLRTGERTLPFFRGLRLILADGAVVTIRRGANSRQPLASVEVTIGGRLQRIWSGRKRVANASHVGAFVGTTLFALGDGGTLFSASVAGPLIGLERVLCPKNLSAKSPKRRLVIAGDLLAASLLRLPEHAPRQSVQFPQVKEAAARFAELGYLFARNTPRPLGAMGELWFPLLDRYRLKVESSRFGMLIVGLYREGSGVPGVEWTIAGKTELHFVRPDGGTHGGPRYFLRGIDMRKQVEGLLPGRSTWEQRARVNRVVAALGGRTPKKLEIKRR